MSSIKQLREGLGTVLGRIPNLRIATTTPEEPKPPVAVILAPQPINYDVTMGRGLDEYEFIVTVLVGGIDQRVMEEALMPYCDGSGTYSVKQALYNDRTLGGVANDCRVATMRGFSPVVVDNNQYLAAEFVVTVYA